MIPSKQESIQQHVAYELIRLQVYEHHCIEQLPGPTRAVRDGALYMANNMEAVQWALELYGFRSVAIKVCIQAASSHSLCTILCCAVHVMYRNPCL